VSATFGHVIATSRFDTETRDMLDLLTLQVCLLINILFSTLVVIVNWRISPGVPGVYEWAIGRMLTAVSILIYALKPVLPLDLIVVIGNAFLYIGYYIIYNGSRRYTGRSVLKHRYYVIGIATLILIHALSVLVFDMPSYTIFFVTILYCGASAIALLSGNGKKMISARFQAATFILHGLFYTGSAIFSLTNEADVSLYLDRVNVLTKLTFLEGSILALLSGMLFVVMTAEYLNDDLKRQTERVASTAKQLKFEVDTKNRFFSIISHDLISPFNVLLGMTHTMSSMAAKFSKEKLVEFSGDVNKAGEQVFELLHNLLEWSRLQMEGMDIKPEEIELQALVQECIDVLTPISLKKGIELTNRVKGDIAFADRDMVKMVIRNLVANSLKFTPSGGTIVVSATVDDGRAKVAVTDSGVGMSEEQLGKIFQLDKKTSTIGTAGESGTGLGLPLCKEILERNGGEIFVMSTPGTGSEFYFTLPALPIPEVKD
jgi:signal transduction histidine kinase